MTPERLQQIQDVFAAALECAPGRRRQFVDQQCATDADLRRDVLELLASFDGDGRFDELVAHVEPSTSEQTDSDDDQLGRRIGSYRILEAIGRGGMGTVYLAERADGHFEQRVALKLLRDDLGSAELRERFLAERQILARIGHPNIARLLDGGVTEAGHPYFVMEHIDGTRIDAYCDQRSLGIDARLELFQTVCTAVQHAHRHLIVHRDLKPGNILVAADGTVKLLDFGIAKLLDQGSLGPRQRPTRAGVRLMTPDYASPEQVRAEPVTTASDVYQLGVLLYELLTGRRPHPVDSSSLADLERVISESDPPPPSQTVSKAVDTRGTDGVPSPGAVEIGKSRGTTPARLRRRLAGDLDNIVLKAMSRDPDSRYSSAEQLKEDIERYRSELPVNASPWGLGYRVAKLLRRRRLAVGVVTGMIVVVFGFAVAMAVQARRTAEERDRAEQVTGFLVDLFQSADPAVVLGDTVTVRDVLERGADRVRTELDDQPTVQARMMEVMGHVYRNLGAREDAVRLLEDALDLRRATLGPDHPEVASIISDLSVLKTQMGEGAAFEDSLRQAVSVLRRAGATERVRYARSLNNLGYLFQLQGRYDSAIVSYERSLAAYRNVAGDTRFEMTPTMVNLGWIKVNVGDFDAADSLFSEALSIRRARFGQMHPLVANSLSALATVMYRQGHLDSAEGLSRRALETNLVVYPRVHPIVAGELLALANIVHARGDYVAADSLFTEALDTFRELHGEASPMTARVYNDFAGRLKDRGEMDRAEPLFRRSVEAYTGSLGEEHFYTAVVKTNLAWVRQAQSDPDEAERLYREAIPVLRGSPSPVLAANPMLDYAVMMMAQQRFTESEPMIREAFALLRDQRPEDDLDVVRAQGVLGSNLVNQQRYEEAEPLLVSAFRTLHTRDGFENPFTGEALSNLITFYERWGRPDRVAEFRAMRPQ